MALRFKLCAFLIGLAHVIPTTFGIRLFGVDVGLHYHNGLTPEEMQTIVEHNQENHQNHIDSLHASQEQTASLTNALYTEVVGKIVDGTAKINDLQADVGSMVTEFINKHVDIMANNTEAHQNQTIILQEQMKNLVIDFTKKHQNVTRELLAGHQNDTAHNQERNRKWMEDFRKASTDAQESYHKMINRQMESHGNLTQDFVARSNKISESHGNMTQDFVARSNGILNEAFNNFKSDGKLLYFGGVGVGVLFLMGVVGIVWKGLFGKCGNKVERYQPNMFAAHPSTYPQTYGPPGYEMVPMVRPDLQADRK